MLQNPSTNFSGRTQSSSGHSNVKQPLNISNKLFVGNISCSTCVWKKCTCCSLMPVAMHILVSSPRQLTVLRISGLLHSYLVHSQKWQQRWSPTEKEAYAVCQSSHKFELYLRGVICVLCCDHKPLEPLLSKGINIPKLSRWSIESADYNI